jgi:putative transcriptional regulator
MSPDTKPTVLIASPHTQDPFFQGTVVLIWHYNEDGAIGVVINRSLEHTIPDVISIDPEIDLSFYADNVVGWGGPVESGSGTLVAQGTLSEKEGWILPDNLCVTRSQEAMIRMIKEQVPILLCLGYAGWGPGQLEREIELGGWLWTDCDPILIFDIPLEDRYARALASLGLSEMTVWMPPIIE